MASSQQPRPTQPSDLLDTPGPKQTQHQAPHEGRAHHCVVWMCGTHVDPLQNDQTMINYITRLFFPLIENQMFCVVSKKECVCVMNHEYEYEMFRCANCLPGRVELTQIHNSFYRIPQGTQNSMNSIFSETIECTMNIPDLTILHNCMLTLSTI